jgi:hypothetical protein
MILIKKGFNILCNAPNPITENISAYQHISILLCHCDIGFIYCILVNSSKIMKMSNLLIITGRHL